MTEDLLRLFQAKNLHATFFVLGAMARSFPELVRRIAAEGHEVATHGLTHTQCFKLTPDEVRREVWESMALLSDIVGKPVLGFRAPEFSVTERSLWVLEMLAELGIQYDSSIFPISGRRYGIPDFPPGPVRVGTDAGPIIEVPLSTVRFRGTNRPVSGGGYFRLMNYPLIKRVVRRVNADGFPFVLYVHPYEFASSRLGLRGYSPRRATWPTRLAETKYNLFRHSMRVNLGRVLSEFRFAPVREVLKHELPA